MIVYGLHVSHSEIFTAYYVSRTDTAHPDEWEYVRSWTSHSTYHRKRGYYYMQAVVERANRMSRKRSLNK